MTSKHIYSSDIPNPKDNVISAHAVDALTSVSGLVRSSGHQVKIHDIQSEVVDLLEPHLRENFGDQTRKIGTKESVLVFSDNQGLLKPNNLLPKNPGRYTAVAPALLVSESLAASHPHTAAFQSRNLQTIFSPSKQDVDLAGIQRQFDDFKQATDEKFVEHEQNIALLKQENYTLKKSSVELEEKIVVLEEKIAVIEQEIIVLKQENDKLEKGSRRDQSRIAKLEEEVNGYKAISESQNAAEWVTLRDTNTIDSIRIRELINRAQTRLARLAQLPGAADESYLADISLLWRQKLHSLGSEIKRIQYTEDTIAGLGGPPVSRHTLRELSSPTSALRTAGDQAAYPDQLLAFGPLIARAKEDQRPLLQELVSFVSQ